MFSVFEVDGPTGIDLLTVAAKDAKGVAPIGG